jgi:acyl-CoA thioester hydrolase
MIQSVYRHRVRYRECDPMGLVYHTHYLDYFEAGRTEALREWGLAYKDLEASGVIMPVVDLAVQYQRPARYDDLLEITSTVREVPTTRVRIEYEVRRSGEPALLATGHVTLCFLDTARNRPIRAPEPVVALFARVLEAGPSVAG